MAPSVRAGGFVVLCEADYKAAEFSARWGAGFGVDAVLTAPGEALGSALAAVAESARKAPNEPQDLVWNGLVSLAKRGGEMTWASPGSISPTLVPSGIARQIDDLFPLFDQLRRAEWGGMAPGARSRPANPEIPLPEELASVPCLDIMVPVLFDDLFAGEPGSRLTRMWHPDRVRRIVDLRRVAFPGVRIFAFPA